MTRDHARSGATDSTGRRGFLRAAAGVGAGALGVGAATTGTADAQESSITTEGAVPSDAPQFGNSDYLGLYVHVAGVNQNASTRNVNCPFSEEEEAIIAYDATILDPAAPETPQADTLLFAPVASDAVEFGRLFIVTDQQECSGDHVQLALDQAGATDIRTSTPNGSDGGDTGDGGEATATTGPGFGLGAAAAGLLGAGELLRRRE